jgi:uncharacterized alpha/beta hydrolase family protein
MDRLAIAGQLLGNEMNPSTWKRFDFLLDSRRQNTAHSTLRQEQTSLVRAGLQVLLLKGEFENKSQTRQGVLNQHTVNETSFNISKIKNTRADTDNP